jgi:hypothetical protein
MADSKITALTALTAADPVNDMFPVVDVSDTSMAASGTTKRISVNNILSSSPTASGALTVTGLVTAGSAAITGAATVGTTLGVTGVSTLTGNVGIGTASSNTTLEVNKAVTFTSGDTFGQFVVKAAAGATGHLLNFGVDTASNLSFIQSTNRGSNVNTLVLQRYGGDVTVGNGNIIPSTAAKGINFTANTPEAGMTCHLLNGYEECTWTPAFTSTGATFGYAQQRGIYTKIGRLVTVSFYLRPNSITGTLTNVLTITGLPFTSTATADYGSSGTWGAYQFASLKTMYLGSSSTTIGINDAGTITATLAAALISGFYLGSISYTV